MSNEPPDNKDIPVLNDLVQRGDKGSAPATQTSGRRSAPGSGLSEAEIEAIAARVIERHTKLMEEAVARAIQKAIERRSGSSQQ